MEKPKALSRFAVLKKCGGVCAVWVICRNDLYAAPPGAPGKAALLPKSHFWRGWEMRKFEFGYEMGRRAGRQVFLPISIFVCSILVWKSYFVAVFVRL